MKIYCDIHKCYPKKIFISIRNTFIIINKYILRKLYQKTELEHPSSTQKQDLVFFHSNISLMCILPQNEQDTELRHFFLRHSRTMSYLNIVQYFVTLDICFISTPTFNFCCNFFFFLERRNYSSCKDNSNFLK